MLNLARASGLRDRPEELEVGRRLSSLVHNASPPIGHSNPPDQAAAMLVDNVVGEANNNVTNENMAMRGSTVRPE